MRRRRWGRALIGVVLILICVTLAIPTLGMSLPFMLYGVFLVIKRSRCKDCGWEGR